jgi:ribonuclease HII
MLKTAYCEDDIIEIGVDEAGRGPMLGRVYTAAVVLPSSTSGFNHSLMKDSKKFHSEKKIRETADYIKQNAIAWAIAYSSEAIIDDINIRNATHVAMHEAIKNVMNVTAADKTNDNDKDKDKDNDKVSGTKCIAYKSLSATNDNNSILLLIDGNDFTPYIQEPAKKRIPHVCIEGGDNTYTAIAAASILAKVSRDDYIAELCATHPDLIPHYDLLKNKGYGTKKHMDGIKTHGITPFHRKTFGICREFA